MIESTETCEREDIQSAVDRAASNKERVKVVCSGKEIAAVRSRIVREARAEPATVRSTARVEERSPHVCPREHQA